MPQIKGKEEVEKIEELFDNIVVENEDSIGLLGMDSNRENSTAKAKKELKKNSNGSKERYDLYFVGENNIYYCDNGSACRVDDLIHNNEAFVVMNDRGVFVEERE